MTAYSHDLRERVIRAYEQTGRAQIQGLPNILDSPQYLGINDLPYGWKQVD
ncbi:hypothetical protein RCF98_17435 [Thiothrix lacustris]|uniref:Uncharacterized protein n=1 Tax=Thiothrix lacustris TaxID=525917 RepID=A0ABY9MQ74_9GAMM|nr:hypothetical protein [Thiothrix lacustris]WML90732.1 hypothetical protein RCF98_17435 [Thiothrix lacustris]